MLVKTPGNILFWGIAGAAHHGRDPLPRVDGSVEHNGGLALAGLAPEVNAGDSIALQRISSRDHFGLVQVLGMEIIKELQVFAVLVIRVEPRSIGGAG